MTNLIHCHELAKKVVTEREKRIEVMSVLIKNRLKLNPEGKGNKAKNRRWHIAQDGVGDLVVCTKDEDSLRFWTFLSGPFLRQHALIIKRRLRQEMACKSRRIAFDSKV